MCTTPHPVAQDVFSRYLEKNVGDPGLLPGTIAREAEAIQELGALLSHPAAFGYIVSGGTEANILALWAAKERAKKNGREVIVSEAAHFSFDKAARLLDLELIKVPLTGDYTIDTRAARARITSRTIALIGIAGSTPLGTVDPVTELAALASEHDLYLHVDAAFGGFVIPFARELGRRVAAFDFSIPKVDSITIDPHKMGMSVIPSGGILFRDRKLAESIKVPVPYLAGGETALATIVGTRSGASVLAVWALIRHLGREGYRATVRQCLELTDYLRDRIRAVPSLTLLTDPVLNIVGVASTLVPPEELARRLRAYGWAVSLFSTCLLYTSPSPRDRTRSRMPSSA